jgi:hypothetical protein
MTSAGRIGFVTYPQSRWRQFLLRAKYLKMRLERNIYPDVYALPLFLTPSFEMIPMGRSLQPGSYDLIFSELNGTLEQISYLRDVVRSAGCPIAVVPGPPEILGGVLTEQKLQMVRDIVNECRYLLAYSRDVASFFDGMCGRNRSLLIPWPFDYEQTRCLRTAVTRRNTHEVRILFNAPLRLNGALAGFLMGMKSVLQDILSALPSTDRARVSFHTFVYSEQDQAEFVRRGFAASFPIQLERKRGYSAFLRFLRGMSAIVHFSPNGVLGRVAFAAAALEIPGILGDNVELHRELYPSGTLAPYDLVRFREAAGALVASALAGSVDSRFKPDMSCASRVGDFRSNAAQFRQLLELA